MSEELTAKIREALSQVADPHMGISIVEMGLVGDIVNENDKTQNCNKNHNLVYGRCQHAIKPE